MTVRSEPALVSVIMNCLNCEKYLREALDSVYAQTYPNWEIIFWDNASTDGSGGIARSYDARVRYFRGDETVPLGQARNLALAQARGEFLAFLDCDDVWLPHKLAKQLPLFQDPEVGLVFADAVYFNETGERKRLYSMQGYFQGRCFSRLLVNNFLCMPTVVLRRAALAAEESWFDPRFNIIEEGDLFTRLAYRWKLAMVAEPLARYRVHAASWSRSKAELTTEEKSLLLAKFKEIIPAFASRYAGEIAAVEAEIALARAKVRHETGDLQGARGHLRPYLWRNRSALALFLLTFLSPRWRTAIISAFKRRFRV